MLIFTTFMSLGADGCEEWWKNICKCFSNEDKDINENTEEEESSEKSDPKITKRKWKENILKNEKYNIRIKKELDDKEKE